jgi:histidinol-phosphate/aromatic aminotransferase/cobyric acid decarboxylase-like protein
LLTPPWAVSLPAQLSAVIALQDEEYYLQKYSETHQLRDEMMGKLSVLPNVEITPTMTNFILFHLEKNGMRADDLVKRCRERNLYIRNVGNMGSQFGDYTIRIAVKDRETNYKIIDIITNVLNAKFANSPSIELNDEVVSSVLS